MVALTGSTLSDDFVILSGGISISLGEVFLLSRRDMRLQPGVFNPGEYVPKQASRPERASDFKY
jgi:hypothetical protein